MERRRICWTKLDSEEAIKVSNPCWWSTKLSKAEKKAAISLLKEIKK